VTADAPDTVGVRFLDDQVAIESNASEVVAWCREYYRQMLVADPGVECTRLGIHLHGSVYCLLVGGRERSVHRSLDGVVRGLNAEILDVFARRHRNLVWLHAAAAAWQQHAIVLPGPSRRGKSTVASLLYALGWTYLADETLAVDVSTATAFPFPLTPAFRASASAAPVLDPKSQCKRRVDLAAGRVARDPMPIGAVVFPQYVDSGVTRLLPAAPAAGALELVLNCRHDAAGRPALLAGACGLMRQVPAFRLEYHDGRQAADVLDRLLGTRRTSG
jgi:hypothetical protein